MKTLAIYDITEDKLRKRMETICKNLGMERIQKSAFLGDMDPQRRAELHARTLELMENREQYDIRILPFCAADEAAATVITAAQPLPEKTELELLGIVIV